MPTYKARDLKQCFSGKLKGTEIEGGNHRRFIFHDDHGNVVASTSMSRSWRDNSDISSRMTGTMQRELHLHGRARLFADLIDCRGSRDEWLRAVTGTER